MGKTRPYRSNLRRRLPKGVLKSLLALTPSEHSTYRQFKKHLLIREPCWIWRAGELATYAAMLVPHQMSMRMGGVLNPEALELFVVKKVFAVETWLKQQNHSKPRLKTTDMARMLGFSVGDELFDLIEKYLVHCS